MKRLLTLILLLAPTLLHAQCANDPVSLQTCINNAASGGTVNVSAGTGTVTWTTGVTITKPISIIGPGSGALTITDNSGSANMFLINSLAACSAPGTCPLVRISGFTFFPPASGTVAGVINALGTCNSNGCSNIRIDHTVWGSPGGPYWNAKTTGISWGINVIGDMFGVVDHNTVNGNPAGGFVQFAETDHATFQGINDFGDNSWAQPEGYGSGNFLFYEDNTFNSAGCCENEGNPGGFPTRGGTRVVVRHNVFNISDGFNFTLGWHGTESNGRARGGRAFEYYQNTITYPSTCVPSGNCAPTVAVRSGTGLVWGNTITSATKNIFGFQFNTLRAGGNPGWGTCDGTSGPDTNDGSGPYFTGTVNTYTSPTLTVNGTPGWATNQWTAGNGPNPQPGGVYSVHDVTQSNNKGYSIGSEIISNGSSTLTLSSLGANGSFAFIPVPGDTITITRAYACLDQGGGRGAGILYSSTSFPTALSMQNAPTSQEVSSPAYIWLTTYTNQFMGGNQNNVQGSADTGRVIRNRDWYEEIQNQTAQTSSTSPFNGTTTIGIGHGTFALRPTTCTANSPVPGGSGPKGVAYWETDHNQLDFCLPNGTWSTTGTNPASYVPFVYPHPLVSGQAQAFAPSCTPVNGVVPQTVTCTNPNGGTTIVCYRANAAPATNGAGTACASGSTQYTGPISVTVAETLEVVAGVASQLDSVVQSYTYTSSILIPTVTTTTAGNITSTSAISGGTVTSNGGASVTSEGVCYATTANPTTPCTSNGIATPFTSTITGLAAGTLYNYRAFATNSAGTGYGANLTFTTPASNCANPVAVQTYTACNSAFINKAASIVSVTTSPSANNGIEIILSACGASCNNPFPTGVSTSISDNINSPEPCFTASPHGPYFLANTGVPDYEEFWAYYCPQVPAGVTTFIASATQGRVPITLGAFDLDEVEWQAGQIATTGYFDRVDNFSSSGLTPGSTATITTSGPTNAANELITALVVNCGVVPATVGSGYTGIIVNPANTPGHILEAQGVTTTGTYSATMSWTGTPFDNCGLGQAAPADTWFGVIIPLSNTPIVGVPMASVNPLTLVFGQVIVNQSQNQNVTLHNTGTAPLAISSIAMSGANYSEVNFCPASLGAGLSCLIQVTFSPAATGGCPTGQCTFAGSLTITDNSSLGSPQIVSTSGQGILVPTTSTGVIIQGSIQQ